MPEITDKAIQEIVALGRQSVGVQKIDEGIPFVVVPAGHTIHPLSELIFNAHCKRPERIRETAKVFDAGSFCEYYRLFADEKSRVFADETSMCLLGILDYHDGPGSPRWGSHRVDLILRHSEEWKRWKGKDGKQTSQMEFAEFIEDNTPDIVSPDGATMLEVARDLRARTDVDFVSTQRIQNGSVRFHYTENVQAKFGSGDLDVPEQFQIAIPVHIGQERVSLTARLRYRINGGKLTFWYNLLRADAAEKTAFMTVRDSVSDVLSIVILNGTPA